MQEEEGLQEKEVKAKLQELQEKEEDNDKI